MSSRLPARPPSALAPAIVGFFLSLAFAAVLATWFYRAPPQLRLSGWFQGDMPTYLCYARMATQSPTTLTYASPHDLRRPPPSLLVNLPISFMGWLLRLGVSPRWIEQLLRLVFGTLLYAALGALLRRIFHPGRWFWGAFFVVGVGSGFAWLFALVEVLPHAGDLARQWHGAVMTWERPYDWWFLDTFRNLMYPLELAYHALIFGLVWALGTRRWKTSVLLCALACLSNPFAGIIASGVQLGSLVLASTRPARPRLGTMAASTILVLGFGLYYGVLLPMDPAIHSLQVQHQAVLDKPLSLASIAVGHGPALLAPLVFFDRRFRSFVWRRFHLVPLILLVLWTAFLTQNSRLPFDAKLQPMHFARGYLHAGLWIVLLAWLQHRLAWPSRPWRGASVALIALLLTLPDVLLFVENRYTELPNEPTLAWPSDFESVHEYLRREPRPRRVLAATYTLGRAVCALHPHRSGWGGPYTTPFYARRQAEMARFRRDPTHETPPIRWAEIIIATNQDPSLVAALRASGRWREVRRYGRWHVFRRASRAPP